MTSPIKRFYPKLSEIINVDEMPEALGFIKDAIEQKLESIYYKDLQVFKGQNGASSSYSITLINNKKLSFTIPGSNGIELVLNPTDDPTDVSIIPDGTRL